MLARVLKPFDYSSDGIRIVRLEAETNAEIRDDLAEGLRSAGYIGDLTTVAAEPVAAPDFDPATADEAMLRAFLATKGMKPHHKTGIDKLRDLVANSRG